MNLYVVTIATDSEKTKYLKKTSELFNVPVHCVLYYKWNGYFDKIDKFEEMVKDAQDDDIVLFVDAYDVLINGTTEEILEKFYSFNCDILFGAEADCMPWFYIERYKKIIKSNSKYKYLNSGLFMGYKKSLISMIQWKSKDKIKLICEEKNGTDQRYFADYFLENIDTVNIKLDTECVLFQNMSCAPCTDFCIVNNRYYNIKMNTYPCFIHFSDKWRYVNMLDTISSSIHKLHTFTLTTDLDKTKYLEKTSEIFKVPVKYIYCEKWNGQHEKIFELKKAIKDIPNDDIVLFVDAYDVLINGSINEAIHKFKEYECDILFGAELNCYPSFCKLIHDKVPCFSKYRYLNSGMFMGYKKNIIEIINWKPENEILEICNKGTDQCYYMMYYIENYMKVNIKLDYKCSIFQNMFKVSYTDFCIKDKRYYNKILDKYPCFVHFNGDCFKIFKTINMLEIVTQSLEHENFKTFPEPEEERHRWISQV